jgi:hypothetical protein
MTALKIIALDAEDLQIVSAHLQDAVVRAADLAFLPRERSFALVANRLDRTAPGPLPVRRRTGLRFARVLSVKRTGFDPARGDTVLNLLAITFTQGESPSGSIDLVFSGDAAIRLAVECIETELVDLGPAWAASAAPRHPDDPET